MTHALRQVAEVIQSDPTSEDAETLQASPLYGVAMLKIAMELKKPNAGALEDILSGVLAKMNLNERDFREFLALNGGLLRTIARKRKY